MAVQNAKFAVGRRKTSIARVKLTAGSGKVSINGREPGNYFPVPRMQKSAMAGLDITGTATTVDLRISVIGGGVSSQSGAVRLGIARALEKFKPDLRPSLKKAGMLRRDPRMVERKKYGLHKARRGTQFSKR